MQRINIKSIRFGSYIKFNVMIFLSIGIIAGMLFLLIGVLGGPVTANLGGAAYSGMTAAVIGLILSPMIFLLFGLLSALMTFLPLKAMLYVMKGIKVNGQFEADFTEAGIDDTNAVGDMQDKYNNAEIDRNNSEKN